MITGRGAFIHAKYDVLPLSADCIESLCIKISHRIILYLSFTSVKNDSIGFML